MEGSRVVWFIKWFIKKMVNSGNSFKAVIAAMKKAMKECKEPTCAQKKELLEMIGALVAHISARVCDSESDESDSESDSECESESDSESDSESESDEDESSDESSDDESSDESSDDEESIVCVGDVCKMKRPYKKGVRSKGRELYKKNGGTEERWRKKSDKFKDNYYKKNRSLEAA